KTNSQSRYQQREGKKGNIFQSQPRNVRQLIYRHACVSLCRPEEENENHRVRSRFAEVNSSRVHKPCPLVMVAVSSSGVLAFVFRLLLSLGLWCRRSVIMKERMIPPVVQVQRGANQRSQGREPILPKEISPPIDSLSPGNPAFAICLPPAL